MTTPLDLDAIQARVKSLPLLSRERIHGQALINELRALRAEVARMKAALEDCGETVVALVNEKPTPTPEEKHE
jgi:hypothetical protein